MNREGNSESEALQELAYHLAAREDPGLRGRLVGAGAPALEEARWDLITLEVVLEANAGALFAQRPRRRDGDGELGGPAPPGDSGAAGVGHWSYALALAASLAVACLAIWNLDLAPRPPGADTWRSGAANPMEVTATTAGEALTLEWRDGSGVAWYRVSVVTAAGALVARRDMDGGCACTVEVRMPAEASQVYWLVEAFDGDWSRVSVASGRVAARSR